MAEPRNAADRAWRHVAYLAGRRCEGRRPGTEGHHLAAQYLETEMRRLGLSVEQQWLTVRTGGWTGRPWLKAGSVQLRYRRDFIETRTAGSSPGVANGPLCVIRDEADADGMPTEAVLLLMDPPSDLDLAATLKSAREVGASALLTASASGSFKGKGGGRWSFAPGGIPALRLSSAAARLLEGAAGQIAHISLPYELQDAAVANLFGTLGGRSHRANLLLVAHYDHVGDDPDGWRYPGALDNASGVAVVLTALNALIWRWPRDVGLAALFTTGEESGLLGARRYSEEPLFTLEETSVINLDVVGADPRSNGYALGAEQPGNELQEIIADVCRLHDIPALYRDMPTDHRPFVARAREVADMSEAAGRIRVHVPEDTPQVLSPSGLDLASRVLVEAAIRWALSNSAAPVQ